MLPGNLFFPGTAALAPQVVPVGTSLMTSAPPVCICGCKNSKVVTQKEKCFPSGYVVFSILTATPRRRRMSVEEEEVVLEILWETSLDWQRSVTAPESSASNWLLNLLIFWQISSPACCLSSPGYWAIVKRQQKKLPMDAGMAQGVGWRQGWRQLSAEPLAAERWLQQPALILALVTRILIVCPWLFSELLLTFKTYCMANWWKIKPL